MKPQQWLRAERSEGPAPRGRRARGERAAGCWIWGLGAAAAAEGLCHREPIPAPSLELLQWETGGSPLACPTPQSTIIMVMAPSSPQ